MQKASTKYMYIYIQTNKYKTRQQASKCYPRVFYHLYYDHHHYNNFIVFIPTMAMICTTILGFKYCFCVIISLSKFSQLHRTSPNQLNCHWVFSKWHTVGKSSLHIIMWILKYWTKVNECSVRKAKIETSQHIWYLLIILFTGKLIKRQRLPKNDVGDHWHWKDFNLGTNVVFYGKIFHVYDCDKWTRVSTPTSLCVCICVCV